jgi:hypothetical protein
MMKSFKDILFNIVDMPDEKILRLLKEYEEEIYSDKRFILFSLIFITVVHISGIDFHVIPFTSDISRAVFNSGYYIAVYIEGMGVYILLMTARAIYKIGLLPMKLDSIFADFHSIGILYSKFTIYAAFAYIIWGIFHMIVPPIFSSLQLVLWFSGFALLLFAYFIIPQYSIHRMMASTKNEKIKMFSSQLKAAIQESSVKVPTKESESHLKGLLSVQDQLDQMCEWPFGAYEIIQLLLIIAIPLIILLFELAKGIIKI